MTVSISVATALETIREDAYINITDVFTGEMLFHGMRNDRKQYTATTLFEPYKLIGLTTRYTLKGQCVVSLDVVPASVQVEICEEEGEE